MTEDERQQELALGPDEGDNVATRDEAPAKPSSAEVLEEGRALVDELEGAGSASRSAALERIETDDLLHRWDVRSGDD